MSAYIHAPEGAGLPTRDGWRIPAGGKPAIKLPTVTVPPELLPLALEIQEARVRAEAEGSLRQRLSNVRTDARSLDERRVR